MDIGNCKPEHVITKPVYLLIERFLFEKTHYYRPRDTTDMYLEVNIFFGQMMVS